MLSLCSGMALLSQLAALTMMFNCSGEFIRREGTLVLASN